MVITPEKALRIIQSRLGAEDLQLDTYCPSDSVFRSIDELKEGKDPGVKCSCPDNANDCHITEL